MNDSSWNDDLEPFLLDIPLPVICISTPLFLAAISLVIAFKLYRLLVYRLALYQVISAEICFFFHGIDILSNHFCKYQAQLIGIGILTIIWFVFDIFKSCTNCVDNFPSFCTFRVSQKLEKVGATLCCEFHSSCYCNHYIELFII